jgi:hypothetical protein
MKGYCKCGKIIDEVTFTQYGMCEECLRERDEQIKKILSETRFWEE